MAIKNKPDRFGGYDKAEPTDGPLFMGGYADGSRRPRAKGKARFQVPVPVPRTSPAEEQHYTVDVYDPVSITTPEGDFEVFVLRGMSKAEMIAALINHYGRQDNRDLTRDPGLENAKKEYEIT